MSRSNGAVATPGRKPRQVSDLIGDPVELPIGDIRPAPVNSLIYRPVNPADPAVRHLALGIKKHGLLDPIVVTREGFIISGHRRYAACGLLEMRSIPCRIAEISINHPDFEALVCEFNRQRVKTVDEVFRECVATDDSGDAYQALIAHRKAKSAVSGDFLKIDGSKKRNGISRAKTPMLEAIKRIVASQRNYWPLSDRSIHYDLLSDPPLRHANKPGSRYKNDRACYQDTCDMLTRARLLGLVPFDAVADETRTVQSWNFHKDIAGFIRGELRSFLRGYWRDLQQSQPNHIEIVGEKNTLKGSIHSVAEEYCIPYTLGRGYCSIDPRNEMRERFEAGGKDKLIILILSDFDPEGEDIPHSFARSMRDDFGIRNVVAKKVCLTYDQVIERKLPQTFDVKTTSPRYKKFAAKYGDRVHEIEALPVAERSKLLRQAINSVLDIDAYNHEQEVEAEDASKLDGIRKKMLAQIPKGGWTS